MKKRLRKKRHLGEFRELGFAVECQFRPDVSEATWDRITTEFILQAIEAHALEFGGGGAACDTWSGVVCRDRPYQSITDEDRREVERWLKANPEIVSYRVSELWDVWHGLNPFEGGNFESV